MALRKIYTIGETVFDITFKQEKPIAAKPGGSSLNTSITLGRLNIPVSFIGEFANDMVGSIINNFLLENNVDTKYATWNNDGQNVVALAFLDNQSDAQYNFYKKPPAERFNFDYPKINKNDIVLFGSISAIDSESRNKIVDFIKFAKEKGAIIIYDPNYRISHYNGESTQKMFEENIALADIIRGSDEDFKNMFYTNAPGEVYKKLDAAQMLIYTANKNGVHLIGGNEHIFVETDNIKPLSTIGAGDTFNAGLIYGLYQNNIGKENLVGLQPSVWEKILQTSVQFSTNVCLSFDNYISFEFAKRFS